MLLTLQIIGLVNALLPLVSGTIATVQSIFGPGTGRAKKEVVLGTAVQAVAADPYYQNLPPDLVNAVVSSLIDRQTQALKQTGAIAALMPSSPPPSSPPK